ncbi:unnamed protein product, partial [Polarella glacialis]
ITVSQCASSLGLAVRESGAWRHYACSGSVFAASLLSTSPLGNFLREVAEPDTIRLVLALVFLAFALLKVGFDGLEPCFRPAKAPAKALQAPEDPAAEVVGGAESPSTAEEDVLQLAGVGATAAGSHNNNSSSSSQTSGADSFPAEPTWLRRTLLPVGLVAGVLGGIAGLNGPPFILMAGFTGLDRIITRTIFPMGQIFEVWLYRLPALIISGRIQAKDMHLYVLCIASGQIGLSLGSGLASRISQSAFQSCIFGFLIASSLLTMGILQGTPLAVAALVVVAAVLAGRCVCFRMRK